MDRRKVREEKKSRRIKGVCVCVCVCVCQGKE